MENISAPFIKRDAYNNTKNLHYCSNCNSVLHNRVSRGWIIRNLFFWLDVKRYRCDKCFKYIYVKSDKSLIFNRQDQGLQKA